MFLLTPSQTIGPFYWGTIVNSYSANLAPAGVAGERLEIVLTLHDVEGKIVPDGLFEVWQANSHGRYNHPDDRRNLPLDAGFEGYGRASTYTDGSSRFSTVKPGRVPWPQGGMQAPHINISIFARGVLNRLATRLYFDGDPANAEDPVLKLVEPARRSTLTAKKDSKGGPHGPVWRLPIHIGGANETVFFDF
jgi:protocatechuate 3,4-dioxygenase alpha subunit